MTRIAILGSGMGGFGSAHRFHAEGLKPVMYDKLPYYGGHTASFKFENGFIFDDGPHISFTKDERIQEIFADGVDQEYETVQARVNNYWRGHWIKHPAQCNLYGLPEDLVVDVLRDFVDAQYKEPGEIRNYDDWLRASYGDAFAERFPMVYGQKFHTTLAENMSTDWLGPRLYRPDLKEVLRGAVSPATPDVHYITHFRYPKEGGFVSYLNKFLPMADLNLNHEVVGLDPSEKRLRFRNGAEHPFDHVISSIPLPDLIPLIDGAPDDVVQAAGRLACTACVLVNVGVDRDDVSENHWTYFYDEDFFFTRLSFPHLFSRSTVPPGASSIQAEVYFSAKYRPLDRSPEDCIDPVIADLNRCGLIRENDKILHRNAKLVQYANVIFDLERADALKTVHGYLEDIGVVPCGRYGDWGYLWTDESFKSGEAAAQTVLDRMSS